MAKRSKPSECIPLSEAQVEMLGGQIMSRDPEGRSGAVFRIRFLSFFGVDPAVVVRAWDMIQVPFFHDGDLSHAQPKHILWALLFLKKYGDESEMAALVGEDGRAVDEKTFRKWAAIFTHRIASLKHDVVSSLFGSLACLLLFWSG